MMSRKPFAVVVESAIPAGIVWDCVGSNQGQAVEVSYGRTIHQHTEADGSSKYKRITDRSYVPGHPDRVTYYSR